MSFTLWNRLPDGFLKMGYKRWAGLDHDVKELIVELAEKQKFKCVHCSQVRKLIIEHDHYPEHGSGEKYTVFNIRGLTCQRCNWHLMIYEKDLNGEHRGFDDVYSHICDREWESYIYAYDCRVIGLLEARLEGKMGTLKYLRRRMFLDKFDDWKEYGARKRHYPWHWAFDEIKTRKKNTIRTPEQFLQVLAAILQYLKNELAKNPDWEPPEEVLRGLFRIKPFLDELRPIVEARMLEFRGRNDAVGQALVL